jgi:dTDP-4-dehydrorhamnose 3,5-epimerase-like enzyme
MSGIWPTFNEPEGVLVPIEFNNLSFEPKRVFYVVNVPKQEERGMHAHYETQQILTCLQGEILVRLHDGSSLQEYRLRPNEWILVDKMIWDSQVFITGNDILMSMCSTAYDKDDYIECFEEFLRIRNK